MTFNTAHGACAHNALTTARPPNLLFVTMSQAAAAPTDSQAVCYCGEVHNKQRPRISPTSEVTRLVEVWVSPEMRAPLSQHLQGDNRPAMDAGDGRQTFWLHVAANFNNPEAVFEPWVDEHTDVPKATKLDCRLVHFRDAEYLKAQWLSNIRTVTEYFNNWTASGQQDPTNFWDYCKGDRVAYYTMKRLWQTNLLYAATKVVPQGKENRRCPRCFNTPHAS